MNSTAIVQLTGIDFINLQLAEWSALWQRTEVVMSVQESSPTITLESLRANDAMAWNEASQDLWRVISKVIQSVLPNATTSEKEDAAADIVHSVVVQIIDPSQVLFVQAKTWKDALNLTATFARRRMIDKVRKGVVRQREESEENIKASLREPAQPADEAIEREQKFKINAAIAELNENDQQLLTDHYFEGLGTREIATQYGSTNGKICYRLVEARKRLAEELEKQEITNFDDLQS